MKLYLVTQEVNTDYDTYDSMVVAAPSARAARNMHPRERNKWSNIGHRVWAKSPSNVSVRYIGEAAKGTKKGVILASFNAG